MSAETPFLPFDHLLATLRKVCQDGRIGTLHVTTDDNRTASLTLLGGEIVGASYRALRGRDSLFLIRSIGLSRFTFTDFELGETDPNLPPTADILALLAAGSTTARQAPPSPEPEKAMPPEPPAPPPLEPPQAAPAPLPPIPAHHAPSLTAAEVARISQTLETELVEYLGPMARVVCREHAAELASVATVEDLHRLVDGMAREIGDAAKEARFKKEAWKKLPWLNQRPGWPGA